LQPEQKKNISQSILETLAVVAYKQPVTRAEIESVRGVRCEYAVSQLQKLGLISAVGRKDVIGKPMLYATTDTFLHKFGLHNLSELPALPLEELETIETV
jgi:segregation and condensation protein B